ncbi:hypothetical protein HYT02_03180 [Candidatus Gottesmanbacteria bacterium]|nr:hypothetical protein [Candidatus Gottesmanbacteria bacterium]
MTSAVERLPKSTIKITITLPWNEVKNTYEHVMEEVIATAEVSGFRKGKAPRKLVEDKIDKTKVYQEVIQHIVPKTYADSVKQHDLKPIVSPRITITKAKENEDWQFEALTCEQPPVVLGKYKEEIAKLKATKKIWVPGKDIKKQEEEEKKGVELSQVLRVLLNSAQVEIPDMLVENQANKKLSELVDQVRTLGMTVEQYLMSKGITSEQLRAQYAREAEETLKLEFILESIADLEKVVISDKEIDEAINAVKDEKERANLGAQRYYISMILRRQKTLDSLTKPIV